MLNEERRKEVLDFSQTLVRLPSEQGSEGAVAEAIKAKMAQLGYKDSWIDRWGNVTGHLKGSGATGKGPVLFDGHIDTIGITGEWAHDPFGAEIAGGRMYGRGTSDMKCAVAAMVCAAAFAAQDGALNRDVFVSGTVQEETVEGQGFKHVVGAAGPEWVIIGEASDLHLVTAQRGRARLLVNTFGVPAHTSTPHLGLNAAKKMAKLVLAIDEIPPTKDDILGSSVLELTELISSPYPGTSVVPDGCRASYDRRLLPGESGELVVGEIQKVIDEMAADDPELRASACLAETHFTTYTGVEMVAQEFSPAWVTPRDHPLVTSAARALQEAGIEPVFDNYRFCTNGSYSAGVAGIPTIGFGPGKETLAHIIDEYLDVEDLLKAAEGYYALASMK
ncbi:MAG: YgeY family selenium metabolism-linked hydrolase [Chloroflexi bacterium]|nr:YgeY family selenium metabolism-linked hydrolase [Chloroflexota bacterium]